MSTYIDFPADVTRIVDMANEHGYSLTKLLAIALWEHHSEGWAAGWLHLPESDVELWNIVREYVEEEN